MPDPYGIIQYLSILSLLNGKYLRNDKCNAYKYFLNVLIPEEIYLFLTSNKYSL
jgi:hypothetical protein